MVMSPRASLREALEAITKNGRQAVLVADAEGVLAGMVTDGDLRRAILRGVPLDGVVADIMNPAPVTASPGLGRAAAVELMLARAIRHLPLVDTGRRLVDVLFLEEQIAAPPLPTPAVIMAGGEGRRLRPLTESTPKPLVLVGGRPLVEIMIERLRQSGITDITIALHHKSEMIRERLGDGARLGVRIGYALEPTPLGTMGALRVTRVEEKPRKEFPVNAGIYLLDPSAVELIPAGEYFDATDLIRTLLDRERVVAAYLIREYWLDIGRLADLEKANRDVADGLLD
ncbi:MAG: hypothetical protein DME16_01150 [Candidatus Rokuibacteriota bacterium]|nr:MAG: hypothetical protein DME16_01150 [Candidatus Rokubacteria bacterium]